MTIGKVISQHIRRETNLIDKNSIDIFNKLKYYCRVASIEITRRLQV